MSCKFETKVTYQTTSSVELSWCNIEDFEVYKVEDTMKLCNPSRVYWYNNIFVLMCVVQIHSLAGVHCQSAV